MPGPSISMRQSTSSDREVGALPPDAGPAASLPMPWLGLGRGEIARATRALVWLPVGAGLVYLGLMTVHLQRILDAIYWNADVAAYPVIVNNFDLARDAHGTVVLGGLDPFYTVLWFDRLTGWLPGHLHIWQIAPYLLSLVGVALLAWASWRVAGRWAAALTGAIGVCASAATLLTLLPQNFHATTWFAAAVLAAYLVLLARPPSWLRGWRLVASAILMAILAGTNLASDGLLWVCGIAPFLAAPLVLWARTRNRSAAMVAKVTVLTGVLAVAVSRLTVASMSWAGITTGPKPGGGGVGLDSATNIAFHVRMLREDIGVLANGTFLQAPHGVEATAAAALGLLSILGLLIVVLAPLPSLVSSRTPPAALPRQLYLTFWALAVLSVWAAFVFTNVVPPGPGWQTSRYVVPFFFAVAAALPVWAAHVPRRRISLALVATLFGAMSILALSRDPLSGLGQTLLAQKADTLLPFLAKADVTRGYTGYWDTHGLAWNSGLRLRITAARQCQDDHTRRTLCPARAAKSGVRSFFLVDPQSAVDGPTLPAPRLFGRPVAEYHSGDLHAFVYPYDIARHFYGP